ncbi:MAG: hypothetical protein WC488_00665 [Candidatus Micrarchaeia archaeon]
METQSDALSPIDKQWKNACRILFGREMGDLTDRKRFLTRYIDPLSKSRSALSGSDVFYSAPYCNGAKFVSFAEHERVSKFEPLSINDIKDMDSLMQSIGERVYYSGNKMLGRSKFVENSENCINSTYVLDSSEIFNCEYIAYSNLIRDSKYLFGCSSGGDSSFCINCAEVGTSVRAFESGLILHSSDVYYSYYARNCRDVLFCFNLTSKNHAIGNNELGRDKYAEMKKELLAQMASELKASGTLPSLVEMVCHD